MKAEDRKKIAEFEADLKKMQKDHKKTFEVFEKKEKKGNIFTVIAERFSKKNG